MLLGGALAMLMAACGPAQPDETSGSDTDVTPVADDGAEGPDTLRVGLGSLVSSLDPNAKTTGPPATVIFYPVFDALTFITGDGLVDPALATSWEATSDTTWEMQLREDVQFSNGEPFDANDVKFTYDRVLNPENEQVVRSRVETIESVEVVDDYTIRITTAEPDPILLKRLASVFILPDEYFAEAGETSFAAEPVGTGPFEFTDFQPSASVTLTAVDSSWRGQPGIDSIEITAMPEAGTRVAALQTNEIDLVEGIPPEQATVLSGESGIRIAQATLGQVNVIILDTENHEALSNQTVRQALNHAVDKQAIVDNIMGGFGEPTGQLVADNGVGHNRDIEPYEYDPARARTLLEEAGYGDGFEMTIYTTEGMQLNDKQMVEATSGYLEEIGIDVSVETIESAAFVDEYHGGGMSPAFFIGWWYFPAMDGDFVYVWNQSQTPQSRFESERFDELYAEARQQIDVDERGETMREMAEFLHESAPVIYLMHPAEIYAVSDAVQGFEPRPDRVIWFDDISLDG